MNKKRMIPDTLLSPQSYHVERIVRKIKKDDGLVYYEVKWVGFEETSLEPQTNPDIRALADKERLKRRLQASTPEEREPSPAPNRTPRKESNRPIVHYESAPDEESLPEEKQEVQKKKTNPRSHKPVVSAEEMKKKRAQKAVPRIKPIRKTAYESKRPTSPALLPGLTRVLESRPESRPEPVTVSAAIAERAHVVKVYIKDEATQTEKKTGW